MKLPKTIDGIEAEIDNIQNMIYKRNNNALCLRIRLNVLQNRYKSLAKIKQLNGTL